MGCSALLITCDEYYGEMQTPTVCEWGFKTIPSGGSGQRTRWFRREEGAGSNPPDRLVAGEGNDRAPSRGGRPGHTQEIPASCLRRRL